MIKITNAAKQYRSTAALDSFSISLDKPGIYCLLGRNGAGKTTLLKSVAGHINLTSGQIEVDGKKVSTFNMPDSLSFVESQTAMFNLKIKDMIKYAAALGDNFDTEFANQMVSKFKLNPDKRYRQLSFGMRTMVSTLLSLANNSKVVMLDEPVLGFDAVMRDKFYTLLQESLAASPRVIIVSTHLIDEIARVVEKVIIIDNGRLMDYFSIEELDEKAYSVTGATAAVEKAVRGLNVVGSKKIGGMSSAFVFDKRKDFPADCQVMPLGLQDYFLSLVSGNELDEYESGGNK